MPSRVLIAAAVTLFAVVLSASGCNNEGEGERCDTDDDNTGTSDCASGLTCEPAAALPGAQGYGNATEFPTLGICCPANSAQATTTVCAQSISPPGSNSGVPDAGDAGTSGEGGADSSTDATLDSASDSPIDSPADSPADALIDSPADAFTDSPGDSAAD